MPIYEYGCRKCGHEFEELVFSDAAPNCPECGSNDVEKRMSCCCHARGGGAGYGGGYEAAPSGGGGCSGCSGGHCASCGH
ncbi:MAG: zinc ribbon domain-containing protein [Desulfovibrionaceae bacterium]|nr:zinc ribbon domain-containing protein [Desulfovibrionaceae bacterium]